VKNIIKIAKLVIITISFAFFLACFWYRFNTYYIEDEHVVAFMSHMGLELDDDRMTKLIKVGYFALTTLSTVGFGDLSPDGPDSKPNISLAFGALILITGVTFFSTLTSNFIEIIQNLKLQNFTISEELFAQWFNLLKRFNNKRELSK